MKKLICIVLLLALLCGCTAAPAQTTAPETTVPETTIPETTAGPVLKAGFYIPVSEDYASMLFYIQLTGDGCGIASMMGMPRGLTWTPEGGSFSGMEITPTAEGLGLNEGTMILDFIYTGDALPEDFIPDPPAPGVYAVSSIGYQGDMRFHNTLSRSNGYLELLDDGTGTLLFEDVTYPFTLDGITARFDSWDMILMDMSDRDTGGPAMVMGYTYDGVIEAESIAFRLLEGE